jgi:hypothetical protein
MSVRQRGDAVELTAAGHRLFEVNQALLCLLLGAKGALTGCRVNSFSLTSADKID